MLRLAAAEKEMDEFVDGLNKKTEAAYEKFLDKHGFVQGEKPGVSKKVDGLLEE
jgi:hypothetical protein